MWVGCIGCKIRVQNLDLDWVCEEVGCGVGHVVDIWAVGLDVVIGWVNGRGRFCGCGLVAVGEVSGSKTRVWVGCVQRLEVEFGRYPQSPLWDWMWHKI